MQWRWIFFHVLAICSSCFVSFLFPLCSWFMSPIPTPKFIHWKPNALGDGMREGTEEVTRSWGIPFHHVRTQTRRPWVYNSKRALTRTWSCWHSDLPTSSLQNWVINFCCLYAIQSMEFCYSSPNGLKWFLPRMLSKVCSIETLLKDTRGLLTSCFSGSL